MARKTTFASIALLILVCGQAFAWGQEGHKITALIAAQRLTPAAKAQVADLLDTPGATDGMVQYASWADEIRRSRGSTAPWHYVDIEITTDGYDAARDCPDDNCVVGQINRDIAILKDKSLAKSVRAEALRFLIHFVGDLHQPLHCADNHDRGGNEVRVLAGGRKTNLHAIWDTAMVNTIGTDPGTVAATLSSKLSPAMEATWSKGTPEQWANESFVIAKREIYGKIPGSGGTSAPIIITGDYPVREGPIAAEQLAKAGVRLAAVLNAALR